MAGRKYSVIGYACGLGGAIPGPEEGPRAIRHLKLIERLERLGVSVADLGDAHPTVSREVEQALLGKLSVVEQTAKNVVPIYVACRELAEKTTAALTNQTTPIILGGDHSFSIGSVAAVSNHFAAAGKKVGLLWIDTHPDINTPESSYSKRIYGMSAAVLLNLVPGLLASLQTKSPAVQLENFCYVGLRDVDPPERDAIKRLGIRAYTMKDIDIRGLATVMQEAIAVASHGTAGFIASFDLDVCDPPLVPGIGFPKRGGLTYREAELVWELLYDSGKLLSIEMVELNPALDRNQITAELGISLIESAVGKTIL